MRSGGQLPFPHKERETIGSNRAATHHLYFPLFAPSEPLHRLPSEPGKGVNSALFPRRISDDVINYIIVVQAGVLVAVEKSREHQLKARNTCLLALASTTGFEHYGRWGCAFPRECMPSTALSRHELYQDSI